MVSSMCFETLGAVGGASGTTGIITVCTYLVTYKMHAICLEHNNQQCSHYTKPSYINDN